MGRVQDRKKDSDLEEVGENKDVPKPKVEVEASKKESVLEVKKKIVVAKDLKRILENVKEISKKEKRAGARVQGCYQRELHSDQETQQCGDRGSQPRHS